MSAANATAPSPSIQDEMRAHEPSMEEILASIRRIIADDDSLPGARREREERRRREEEAAAFDAAPAVQSAYPAPALEPGPEPVAEARPQPATVADIRQLRLSRVAPDPVVEEADAAAEEEEYDDEPELTEALVAAHEAPVDSYEALDGAPLVSAEAASSIASHFQALAASMFINDSGLLQKYAQEMLRPMLKQWLDDNLPVIVERLVRAEIERVARGGRR
ncbi:PopZ family protein [Methylocystis sp. JAN1]|uniref:PopZ family protein n=1 Tax=Methylocystis sp. JAN1 TaxID=3397211 RepID=UPI003FA294DE